MAKCIRMSVREVLGISRGGASRLEGAWWWNEEMKEKVKEKHKAYATLVHSTLNQEREVYKIRYKEAKKLAKKAITLLKNNAIERLYHKLETKEGEKGVFKL